MSGKIEISRELAERLCVVRTTAEGWITSADAIIELRKILAAPVVERQRNQCDGCQAGKPLENGNRHRMSNGAYPDFMACTAKLYTSPPAPLAVDAAKAFAKGFNTLETLGGKYKIVMQFAGHDDAWEAYSALSHMTACLDKVKELNQ